MLFWWYYSDMRRQTKTDKDRDISLVANENLYLGQLGFEEVLEDLLKIKPIDNKTLLSKKKNPKPKTKK